MHVAAQQQPNNLKVHNTACSARTEWLHTTQHAQHILPCVHRDMHMQVCTNIILRRSHARTCLINTRIAGPKLCVSLLCNSHLLPIKSHQEVAELDCCMFHSVLPAACVVMLMTRSSSWLNLHIVDALRNHMCLLCCAEAEGY